MNTTRGITSAWLGHPVTMGALAVLVINDHVLKATHPGWVTGKLSDAAGMLLMPPLLAALAGLIAPRLPLRAVAVTAIVTVGVGFTFVKMWAYGAELASSTWSTLTPSLIRADPTDLLVLPLLAGAWSTLRHSAGAWLGYGTLGRGARVRPEGWTLERRTEGGPGRWTRAVRVAVLMPLALAGVAATSPAPRPLADLAVVSGDAVYVGASERSAYSDDWSVSRDGGVTWDDAEEPASPQAVACSRDGVCYRVVTGALAVQSSTGGGPWTDSWRVDDAQRRALYREYGDSEHISDLTSRALTVQDVPGGHVVVVANGRDGFAVRATDGRWERIGFPAFPWDRAPLALPTGPDPLSRPLVVTVIALIAGFLLTVAGVVSLRRSGASRHWWWLPALLPAAAILLVPPVVLAWLEPASILTFPAFFCPFLAVGVAVTCTVTALAASGAEAAARRTWLGSMAVAVLVTAGASAAAWQLMT
ncbi:hypothetical protein [Actinoplanes subglobosus]|uniref:Uncharacterized protein n=1 Tax=Actinoplanes subglobosus TaxID=1547892 RepID=A0ABV8J9E8_9ACTN